MRRKGSNISKVTVLKVRACVRLYVYEERPAAACCVLSIDVECGTGLVSDCVHGKHACGTARTAAHVELVWFVGTVLRNADPILHTYTAH